jgi:hypothetical protein
VLKRVLRRERWETSDPVWWRREKQGPYERMSADDVETLHAEFERRGRVEVLEAV